MASVTPHLILLAVNLLGLNGTQVLARLKGDTCTRHIPVIMLTSSDDPELIETCLLTASLDGCGRFRRYPQPCPMKRRMQRA